MDIRIQNKNTWILLASIGILFILNIVTHGGVIRTIQKPLYAIGSGFYSLGSKLQYTWIGITEGKALLETIAKQEQFIGTLVQETIDQQQTKELAATTEQFASLEASIGFPITSSRIIFTTRIDGEKIFVLRQPKDTPYISGQAVVSPEGFLVGKIIEVTPTLAFVQPITNKESTVAVTMLTNAEVQSIVRGQHGVSLFMELIPQDAVITEHALVVTSSLEEEIPVALPVGKIVSVHYTEGELFQTAVVAPLSSIQQLRVVGVVMLQI